MRGKESLNVWNIKEYIRNISMILLKIPIWCIQLTLFWMPIDKNKIIIYSLKQHGYSCNLKYLTEYLREKKSGVFQVMWIVKNDNDFKSLSKRGIPVAMLHSGKHFLYRMRAGIVLTNDEFYPMFIKRKGQLYVNTWHGGINYKKIGYAGLEFTNPIQKFIFKMGNPCPDIFVSGSKSFTTTTSNAFRFPKKIFLACGLPRNDIFFADKEKDSYKNIKRKIGIPEEKKILLYAPTFRKGNNIPQNTLNYIDLLEKMGGIFGGEWCILLRQHYFVESDTDYYSENIIDVSDYEDMQELICISDCLISDYSSCMWDFIITGKPCFVYAEDISDYNNFDRSFSIPISAWPYPICQNVEELYNALENFNSLLFRQKVEEHRKEFGSYDRGNACEKLVTKLEEYVGR